MSRQKKRVIMLTVTVLALGGLIGVYFWQLNNQRIADAEAAAAPKETVNLNMVKNDENTLKKMEFTSENGTLTLLTREAGEEREWYLEQSPDTLLNQYVVDGMRLFATNLNASERMLDTVDDTAEYGINPSVVRAVGTFEDGSTAVVHIGKLTPDRENYYVMVEGDPALYLISSSAGDRYSNTEKDIVDKSLPTINPESYDYLLIAERDKPVIEFDFIGTQEEADTMRTQFGMIALKMIQPYYGRDLYYSTMQSDVLDILLNMRIGDMVDFEPADLSAYGLDEPSLEFCYRLLEEEIHLQFGDRTEDGQIYVKFYDRPHVFLTDYSTVSVLYGIKPLNIVEKFIALIDIMTIDSVTVDHSTDASRDYTLEVNHDVLPPEEDEEEGRKVMYPTVNGKEMEEDDFKALYRYLIGLTADSETEPEKPSGQPVFTVSYNLIEGEPILVSFYEYDTNFYTAWREGVDFTFVTNKQNIELFFKSAAGYTAS